jgi:hypothetical protein
MPNSLLKRFKVSRIGSLRRRWGDSAPPGRIVHESVIGLLRATTANLGPEISISCFEVLVLIL